jgi:hypothetical protein
LWLTPTRTFTVLMWRPRGRTHAGMDSRHPGRRDASGNIHVDLGSSTPCWNDAIGGVLPELTEAPSSRIFKGAYEGQEGFGDFDNNFVLFPSFVVNKA